MPPFFFSAWAKRASAGLTSMRHEHACSAAASAQSDPPQHSSVETRCFTKREVEHLRNFDAHLTTKMRLRAD